jgi:hypothetical protein
MPREPREPRTDVDKQQDEMIRKACVDVMSQIDSMDDDRSVPPSRSDLWVSIYRQDLCAIIRRRMSEYAIVLDREIIRVWLTIRKNPAAHGVTPAHD